MGGSNPYIEEVKYTPATKKYKVTFLPSGKTDRSRSGKSSLRPQRPSRQHPRHFRGLQRASTTPAAASAPAPRATSSFKQGLESCNEATDAELDELDEAPGITPKSRLGCQTVPDGTTDIVVEIPEWNKNYAKEADH